MSSDPEILKSDMKTEHIGQAMEKQAAGSDQDTIAPGEENPSSSTNSPSLSGGDRDEHGSDASVASSLSKSGASSPLTQESQKSWSRIQPSSDVRIEDIQPPNRHEPAVRERSREAEINMLQTSKTRPDNLVEPHKPEGDSQFRDTSSIYAHSSYNGNMHERTATTKRLLKGITRKDEPTEQGVSSDIVDKELEARTKKKPY